MIENNFIINKKISIIICVFNAENFIERSIQSVINQTYKNIELIIINDGSTDSTLKIIEKINVENIDFKLKNTINQGISIARNEGLELVQGEFVVFLDADDFLEPTMLEQCVKKIINDHSDIVVCKYNMINKYDKIIKIGGWNENNIQINNNLDLINHLFFNNIIVTVWAKMFTFNMIKNIRFMNKDVWYEDTPFLFECFINLNKISFIKQPLINIQINPNSITRRLLTEKRIIDFYEVYLQELKIAKKYNLLNELKTTISLHTLNYFIDTICLFIIHFKNIENKKRFLKIFKQYIQLFRNNLLENNIKLNLKTTIKIRFLLAINYNNYTIILIIFKWVYKKKMESIKKIIYG